MRIGVPRETAAGERRVALVPEVVGKLAPAGFEVLVERGAGEAASFPDAAYEEAGARLVGRLGRRRGRGQGAEAERRRRRPAARGPGADRLPAAADRPGGIERLAQRGVIAFAMESIPRITRAQAMDALRRRRPSPATRRRCSRPSGCRSFFPMLMTAAGTVAPAKVLVLGAGVAGLQAIATARRLGAVVTGFDVRPVVREQIESLGANWLEPRRHRRGDGRRLRDGAHRGAAAAAARGARRADAGVRRRDHDRADPGPAGAEADPGERRRGDAPGLGRSSTWPPRRAATVS